MLITSLFFVCLTVEGSWELTEEIQWSSKEFPPLIFCDFYTHNSFVFKHIIYSEKAQNALHLLIDLRERSNIVSTVKN